MSMFIKWIIWAKNFFKKLINSLPAIYEVLYMLLNPKFRYRIHKTQPMPCQYSYSATARLLTVRGLDHAIAVLIIALEASRDSLLMLTYSCYLKLRHLRVLELQLNLEFSASRKILFLK